MEDTSLAEIFRVAGDAMMTRLNKALPGKVVAYDAAKQTAHVQPMIKRMLPAEDGTKTYESLPLLPNVPVCWWRAGGFAFVMPLAVGDPVWLEFADGALAEYLETGNESEPWDTRRHHLSNAVCMPCLYPDTNPIADGATGGMVLGKDGNVAQIRIVPGEIKLGADASQFVALSNLVLQELQTLQAAVNAAITVFNAHTHVGVTPGPGITATPTSGTTASPVPIVQIPAVAPQPVAAVVVKAK